MAVHVGAIATIDPIYIIRDANFGQNFTVKLVVAIIGFLFVLWDMRTQKRRDYLWVWLLASLVWALAEAFLQIQGTRDMPNRILFGRPAGMPIAMAIQGMCEAAFITTIGLFAGDRWLVPKARWKGMAVFGLVCLLTFWSTYRNAKLLGDTEVIASRRDITDPVALTALVVLSAIAIYFLIRYRQWRPRTLAMFIFMVVFATVWTLSQWGTGGRWVQVGDGKGGFVDANALHTIGALGFDVLVEIALIYVAFLAVPVMVGLVRDPRPLPRSVED